MRFSWSVRDASNSFAEMFGGSAWCPIEIAEAGWPISRYWYDERKLTGDLPSCLVGVSHLHFTYIFLLLLVYDIVRQLSSG